MASLLNNDELDPTAAAATQTSTSAGGGDSGVASSGTAPNAPVNTSVANQNDIAQIGALNQSVDFSPLLDYVKGQGTAARSAIGSSNDSFNTSLGTFNPFGDTDKSTLDSVISGSQPLATGQSLLSKSYSGPSSFSTSSYDPLISRYATSAGQTQSPTGIDTLLQSMRPDLTPGERSYDSLVYGQNPNYQSQSRDLVNDAGAVSKLGSDTASNALTAAKQRQSDISGFNTAGQGYVTSQRDAINQALSNQMAAANQQDTATQAELDQLRTGAIPLQGAANLSFDPNAYTPTSFASLVGGDFNQTVNPNQFLTYNPGQAVTRENVATGQQAQQYNNEESLLNLYDKLSANPRQAASLGINMQALQQALLQAGASRDAADAAWTAAHQPVRVAPPVSVPFELADPKLSGGGGGEGPSGGDTSGGDSGDGGEGGDGGGEGGGEGGDGGGEGGGEGGEGGGGEGGGGDGFFKGGLVKKPRNSLSYSAPKQSNAPPVAPPMMPPQQQLAMQMAQQQAQQTPGTLGFERGGYIPVGTGNPAIRDDIPARVDDGEFVLRRPAVNVIGAPMLAKLNQADPAHRAAIHAALSHALAR